MPKAKPEKLVSHLFENLDIYQDDECDIGPRILDSVAALSDPSLDSGPQHEQILRAFKDALKTHKSGNYNKAREQYLVTICTSQACLTQGSAGRGCALLFELSMKSYNNIGCIDYLQGNGSSARLRFQSALLFAQQLSDCDVRYRLSYANVLSNWCRTRWSKGHISEAVYMALLEIYNLRASLLTWDHPDMAASHYNLALADWARHQKEPAALKLTQYMNIWSTRTSNGMQDVDPIPALIHLLLIRHEDCNDEVAQDLARGLRTLQDKRQLQGPRCPDVASVLNCIGTLLFHKRDYESSLIFFQEELRLEEMVNGKSHDISVSVTCNNIGRILQELGRYHEAVHYYERALEKDYGDVNRFYDFAQNVTQSSAMDSSSSSALNLYSTAWYNLGLIQDKLGHFRDAITSFKMSLGLRKLLLGHEHPDIACLHYNIGVLQMEQDLLNDASASFRDALRIRSTTATEQLADCHVIKTLGKLASLHKEKGNVNRALEATQDILAIQKISSDLNEEQRGNEIAMTMRTMAELLHALGDLHNAAVFATESVRTLENMTRNLSTASDAHISIYIAHTEQLISSMLLLGSIYHEQAQPIPAITVFQNALRTLSDANFHRSDRLSTLHEVTYMLVSSHCAPQA